MNIYSLLSILVIVSALSLVNGFASTASYDNTKGFTTFNSLPTFPFIGGAPAVAGWNSPKCGSCWALTYKGKTINVLAIDAGPKGFNIAQRALDVLTNGQAVQLGRVDVTATEVAASKCGL